MNFEELVKKISEKLRGLIYNIHFASSFLDREDLFQEAICHLWLRFRRGELVDKNESYILKSCYFHLKNFQRTHLEKFNLVNPAKESEDENETMDPLEFISEERDNFNYLNAKILVSDIQNNGLTKREREVFNLLLQGLTVREISRCLKISHVRVIKIESHIKGKYEKKFKELPK